MSRFADLLNTNAPIGNQPTQWYRNQAAQVSKIDTQSVIKNSRKHAATIEVGNMYLFAYDPKYKQELPYYDRFPLIFPFKTVKDGFYGINMHYLPYMLRAKLMDGLYKYVTSDVENNQRLVISYNLLNSASRLRYFKPCVKHYLNKHVKSRFVLVEPSDWDVALFLPLQRFVGATPSQVFADSMKRY